MESNSERTNPEHAGEVGSGAALLGRLMWMVLGPMLMLLITYALVTRAGWFTPRDAAFGIVVTLMVGGRWVEQRSGAAMTATGEPAGAQHFKRYARILLPLATGVWVTAKVLGNHVLA